MCWPSALPHRLFLYVFRAYSMLAALLRTMVEDIVDSA